MQTINFSLSVFLTLLATTALLPATQATPAATEYAVINTAGNTKGGALFSSRIGEQYAKHTMESASNFIFKIFNQPDPAGRKPAAKVTAVIDGNTNDAGFYASDCEFHVGAKYLANFTGGDVKFGFVGLVYRYMAYVWGWDGGGKAPAGLRSGIGEYVRVKAGFGPRRYWAGKRDVGAYWAEGGEVTARFLNYCVGLREGFVWEMNERMKGEYSDGIFKSLLGKDVDQLWRDYKAKYGTIS